MKTYSYCLQFLAALTYTSAKPTHNTPNSALPTILQPPNNTTSHVIRTKRSNTQCTDPTDASLWQQYLDYVTHDQTIPESFYMAGFLKESIQGELGKSSGNTDAIIEGRPEVCESSTDAHAPLYLRSTCPYFLVRNVDTDR